MSLPRHKVRARQGSLWRHWSLWIYFPLALVLILAGVCLWKSGRWLVSDDPFEKVEWAVVLAGEGRDAERSEAALRLYLDGRIDTLIYSGIRVFKDRYSSDFMTDWLAKNGYPREKLFEFRQDAYSTQEEAGFLIRQFRQQGLDTVLIITSNFHTARTRRIFRELAQGYPFVLVHAAELKDFEPSAWWSSREGRKHWLMEWTKTFSTWFELLNAPPETGKSEVNALINKATGDQAEAALALPPPPSREDSLASAALDSLARTDSAAAAKDTTSATSATGDSTKAKNADTADTGQAAPSVPTEKSGKIEKPEKASKEDAVMAKVSAKSTVKSTKAESTPSKTPAKTPAKKPAEKTSEKSSKASDKDKKKAR